MLGFWLCACESMRAWMNVYVLFMYVVIMCIQSNGNILNYQHMPCI